MSITMVHLPSSGLGGRSAAMCRQAAMIVGGVLLATVFALVLALLIVERPPKYCCQWGPAGILSVSAEPAAGSPEVALVATLPQRRDHRVA